VKHLLVGIIFILTTLNGICQETENFSCNLCEHPYFPGGIKAQEHFIQNSLVYPISAIEDSIEGKVWLRFIVSSTGNISNITIARSLRSDCDSAAILMLSQMPPWKFDCLQPHAVYANLPVVFKLGEKINPIKDEK